MGALHNPEASGESEKSGGASPESAWPEGVDSRDPAQVTPKVAGFERLYSLNAAAALCGCSVRTLLDRAAKLGWFKPASLGKQNVKFPETLIRKIREQYTMKPDWMLPKQECRKGVRGHR